MKKVHNTLLLLLITAQCFAQGSVNADSVNRIIKIGANLRIFVTAKDSFKTVVGVPAEIRQGTTLFRADSIYISDKVNAKYMEAFGRVYINESDSVITTAKYLKYYTDKKLAVLKNDVYIKSSGGTFTSNEVEYDLTTKMAVYKNNAKIVSKTSVLTSKAGTYYSNSKDALFTNNVVLNGPAYNVKTDTLYYNTSTEIAQFVTYTKIVNTKTKQVIETTRGFYDMKKGIAQFDERSIIKDSNSTIIADKIISNDKDKLYKLTGKASIEKIENGKKDIYRGNIIDIDNKNETYHIEGNGLYSSEKENFVITGNYLDGDGKSGKFLARGKPVAIIKQENDSIYIAADTLYSGRIVGKYKTRTDSITKKTYIDTLKNSSNTGDSTKRYFEAFHHVRIYSDSVQAVADSLYYTEVDSTFRLYQNPIVWNNKNQITGDTIYLYTKNKKASKVEVFEKGFVINLVEPKFYNQIKATKITGYLNDGNIDSLYAKGTAEIIFYIIDEDNAFVGVDKSIADVIIAYFENKEIYKLKWLNKYDATTTPMKEVNHETMRLRYFNLQFNKRPKSKFELFF